MKTLEILKLIISMGVTNFNFKKKIDHIIHLAAETSEENKDKIQVVNTIINGTIRVLSIAIL